MRWLLLAAGLVGTGCGPAVEDLVVDTTANAFAFSASFRGASGWEDYDWRVSGERGWVEWDGTVVEEGLLVLTLTDASGTEVYREQADVSGLPDASATRVGTPGEWNVQVRWIDAHGRGAVQVTGVQ